MAEGAPASSEEPQTQTMNLRAVVIGGTGAVGKHLVGELLTSKNFSKVVVLGRRNVTVPESYNIKQSEAESEGRLVHVIVDFETLTKETAGKYFQDKDVFFNTLGTTRRNAGSAAAFIRIDHDYPMKCIEIAKECGVTHMSLLTSQGANPNSMLLYLKCKGNIEEDSKKLDFKCLSIFRPGLLGRGSEARLVEKISAWFVKTIQVSEVAKGMRIEAEQVAKNLKTSEESKEPKVEVYTNREIWDFCRSDA